MSEEHTPAPAYNAGTPWRGVQEYVNNNGGLDEIRVDVKTKAGPIASLTFKSFEDVARSFNDITKYVPSKHEVKSVTIEELLHTSDSKYARFPVSIGASKQQQIPNKETTDFDAMQREGLRKDGISGSVSIAASQQQQSTHTTNIDYNAIFDEGSTKNLVSQGPNKKKTDFTAIFNEVVSENFQNAGKANTGLTSLIQAASLAKHQTIDLSTPFEKQQSTRKSDKKKKMRKFVPNEKVYVDECKEQGEFTTLRIELVKLDG